MEMRHCFGKSVLEKEFIRDILGLERRHSTPLIFKII